jgi:hypothetical protein
MCRRLALAACTLALYAASLGWSTMPALAYDRAYHGMCVVAEPGARLFPLYSNRCDDCWRPGPRWVRPGRAFRVDRQAGGFLKVWHLQGRGWLEHRCARIVHEELCVAAGI